MKRSKKHQAKAAAVPGEAKPITALEITGRVAEPQPVAASPSAPATPAEWAD